MPNNSQQIKGILGILKNTYPNAKIVLNYRNNWELLVAVILSAQCTDIKVNQVTSKLFPKYLSRHSEATPRGRGNLIANRLPRRRLLAMTNEQQEITNYALAPLKELEQDIKSTGFYHNKGKNIQNAAKMILEKYHGQIPDTMPEILKLPGVARKTANVVLGNAYGIIEGIAVDTHVLRISQRLRLVDLNKIGRSKQPVYFDKQLSVIPESAANIRNLSKNSYRFRLSKAGMTKNKSNTKIDYYKDTNPEKIEQELMKIIPKKDWFKFTYQIIDHGRAICKAQKPKCEICPLSSLCPASRIQPK